MTDAVPYKKITIIVEDNESIETTIFPVIMDLGGSSTCPNIQLETERGHEFSAPLMTMMDVELHFIAFYDERAGIISETKREKKT